MKGWKGRARLGVVGPFVVLVLIGIALLIVAAFFFSQHPLIWATSSAWVLFGVAVLSVAVGLRGGGMPAYIIAGSAGLIGLIDIIGHYAGLW